MSVVVRPWTPADHERVRAMAAHASIQPDFDLMLGAGFDRLMSDPYAPAAFRWIATVDGVDAGFSFAFLARTLEGRFAAFRIAVLEGARRRGAGTTLLERQIANVQALAPDCEEWAMAAIVPSPAAEGFTARHGFAPTRKYWRMERPGREVPAPEWPEGVRVRTFDGSEADIARWVEVFNRSWAGHDHGILATVEDVRQLTTEGVIDPSATFFAERDGRAVGFVRNALHATRGEIAVLGVVPEERQRGLGRALLRHGCRELIARDAEHVTLLVDGQNESALTLYRNEAFEVAMTRQIWTRWKDGAKRSDPGTAQAPASR